MALGLNSLPSKSNVDSSDMSKLPLNPGVAVVPLISPVGKELVDIDAQNVLSFLAVEVAVWLMVPSSAMEFGSAISDWKRDIIRGIGND